MKSIAIQNIKGGTGKTTTTIHLAAGILHQDPQARVLVIDCDQQASIKAYFRLKLQDTGADIYDFLINDRDYRDCVQRVELGYDKTRGSFDVLLASRRLAEAEIRLSTFPRREEALKLRFEERKIAEAYDYVLFDCPPTLNLVTYNVLLMSNFLVIPCGMDFLSVVGVQTVLENISLIEKYFKTRPEIIGILPTFYDKRTTISEEIIEQLKKGPGQVYRILDPIRVDTKLKNAQARKMTVFEYAADARSTEDYIKLTKCVLNATNGHTFTCTKPRITQPSQTPLAHSEIPA